jgi:hypothetical protein
MYLPATRKPWHPSYLSRHRSEEQQRCPAACSFVVVAEAPRRIFFAAPKGAGSPGVNVRASIEQARFRLGASGIVAFVWVTVSSRQRKSEKQPIGWLLFVLLGFVLLIVTPVNRV